jgi:hypothetical protein
MTNNHKETFNDKIIKGFKYFDYYSVSWGIRFAAHQDLGIEIYLLKNENSVFLQEFNSYLLKIEKIIGRKVNNNYLFSKKENNLIKINIPTYYSERTPFFSAILDEYGFYSSSTP